MTTAVYFCEFETIVSSKGGTTTVSAMCQAEGEEGGEKIVFDIITAGKKGYRITARDGTDWGPLAKCK